METLPALVKQKTFKFQIQPKQVNTKHCPHLMIYDACWNSEMVVSGHMCQKDLQRLGRFTMECWITSSLIDMTRPLNVGIETKCVPELCSIKHLVLWNKISH